MECNEIRNEMPSKRKLFESWSGVTVDQQRADVDNSSTSKWRRLRQLGGCVNCYYERTDRRTDRHRSANLPATCVVRSGRHPSVRRLARDLATDREADGRASTRHRRRCLCPIKRRPSASLAGPLPGRQVAVISRVQTAAARRAAATLRLSSPATGL